jgi:hypothetical protein
MFVAGKKSEKIYSIYVFPTAEAPLFLINSTIFTRSPTIYQLLPSYCTSKLMSYSSTMPGTHVFNAKKAKQQAGW